MGGRITPMRVVVLNAPGGDVEMLYRAFGEWEMWTADVLESHVSYPMLALFRSQHRRAVVGDGARVGDGRGDAGVGVRGGRAEPGAVFPVPAGAAGDPRDLGRLHIPRGDGAVSWLNEANFDLAWNGLVEAGLPLRDKAAAWADLQAAGHATATSSSA